MGGKPGEDARTHQLLDLINVDIIGIQTQPSASNTAIPDTLYRFTDRARSQNVRTRRSRQGDHPRLLQVFGGSPRGSQPNAHLLDMLRFSTRQESGCMEEMRVSIKPRILPCQD